MSASRVTTDRGDGREGPARARIVPVDTPQEGIDVRWNPAGYRLRRAPAGAAAGREEFSTDLVLDTEGLAGADRDARRTAEVLRRWMDPRPGFLDPPKVLFSWGTFRFAGVLSELEEEWTRFDPDGTPRRGRARIVIRG